MCDAVVWQIVEAMHQEHLAGLLRQTGNGPLQSRNQRIGMFVEMGDGGRRDQQVPDRAREADGEVLVSHATSSAEGGRVRSHLAHDRAIRGARAEWQENGRASCRERVCQSVWILGVGGTLKKKK